jgi:hypothetical protein
MHVSARRFQQVFAQRVVYATDARRAEGEALLALGRTAEREALLLGAKAAGLTGAAPS